MIPMFGSKSITFGIVYKIRHKLTNGMKASSNCISPSRLFTNAEIDSIDIGMISSENNNSIINLSRFVIRLLPFYF